MKTLYIFALLATLSSAQATPLEDLDQFLGCPKLADSFHLNDEVSMLNESCVGSACDSFHTKMQITAAENNQVTISSLGSDGKVFQQDTLTQERWTEIKCNMARAHIENLQSSGFKTEIGELTKSQRTLAINGETKTIETRSLEITGENTVAMKVHHKLELAREGGGLAQLFMREQNDTGAGVDRFTVESTTH